MKNAESLVAVTHTHTHTHTHTQLNLINKLNCDKYKSILYLCNFSYIKWKIM